MAVQKTLHPHRNCLLDCRADCNHIATAKFSNPLTNRVGCRLVCRLNFCHEIFHCCGKMLTIWLHLNGDDIVPHRHSANPAGLLCSSILVPNSSWLLYNTFVLSITHEVNQPVYKINYTFSFLTLQKMLLIVNSIFLTFISIWLRQHAVFWKEDKEIFDFILWQNNLACVIRRY